MRLFGHDSLLFHPENGDMHPGEAGGDDDEEQHEATRPDAGEVVERAEGNRQYEAAESADHADQAADRADIAGVVDRDVLVDGGLAYRHEEAKDEGNRDKRRPADLEMEIDRPVDAAHDIIGGRQRQHCAADQRDRKGPVEHSARADLVRENAAIGAEDRGWNGIGSADHAGCGNVETVDADQIARQPERQRDEAAEDEEVIQRKAPDADVPQRLELGEEAARLACAVDAALADDRIVFRGEPEHHRHHGERHGPDQGDTLPAPGEQREGGDELGHRGADIADAEDAERRALPAGRVEAGDIGDANREGTTRQTDAERGD